MLTTEDISFRLAMPARLLALEQSGLMDSEQEEAFDRITRLVREIISCDVCLISLVDDRRQFFKSAIGLPEPVCSERQTPLSHSFCKYVVASEQPLIISDARNDARVRGNGAIRDLNVIAYLGMPIRSPQGGVLGSLCVIKSEPHEWSEKETAVLRDFNHLLENTIRARAIAAEALQAAKSNAVLAREYHHRVKNALAVSACLVRSAGRKARTVEDLVRDCDGRFASLGRAQDLVILDQGTIELGSVVDAVLSPLADGDTSAGGSGPRVLLGRLQVTPVALILHELATNSAKYGALKDGGRFVVTWAVDEEGVTLACEEATALGNSVRGGGFGSQLFEIAARQLKGRLGQDYADGVLRTTVTFPLEPASAQTAAD